MTTEGEKSYRLLPTRRRPGTLEAQVRWPENPSATEESAGRQTLPLREQICPFPAFLDRIKPSVHPLLSSPPAAWRLTSLPISTVAPVLHTPSSLSRTLR